MAYRRRQQEISRPSPTFEDEGTRSPTPPSSSSSSSFSSFEVSLNDIDSSFSSSSLAAKAIRASSARRDSSLSSVYGHSNLSTASRSAEPTGTAPLPSNSKDSRTYEYTSMKSLNESKHGFWGALSRKAKSILEDDNANKQSQTPGKMGPQMPVAASSGKFQNSNHLEGSNLKRDSPKLLKGLDAITSSLTQIGGSIGKSLEEGFTIVESRTSDIIQETRKHIRKKPGNSVGQSQETNHSMRLQSQLRNQMPPMQKDQELQLKASRDVAMAMAAKAKLLLRELKTVKADLAFAKERCAQLEEENKILCENRKRGDSPEDDDLIRLQLETLLAEKARLAHENSVYARENRFLREVVEYHQLTMQDVVYLDESNEEVTEVNPLNLSSVPNMLPDSLTPSATSLSLPLETALSMSSELTRGISSPIAGKDAKSSQVARSISSSITAKDDKSSEVTSSISSSSTGKDAK